MAALCGQDREIIAIWREHGIPLDRTTVDHARLIIDSLAADLDESWRLISELMENRPVVCGACAAEVQPPLPLKTAPDARCGTCSHSGGTAAAPCEVCDGTGLLCQRCGCTGCFGDCEPCGHGPLARSVLGHCRACDLESTT